MNLEKLVAVSGLSGIYKMAANRNNGLIIEDLDTGKKRFAPSRKHQFTPLESIAIYTDTDSKQLSLVFQSMIDQMEDTPIVAHTAPPAEIKEYFSDILPDYDPDRVHLSDMKKVIKWFVFLNDKGLLKEEAPKKETKEKETPKAEEAKETAPPKEAKTTKEKKAKAK